MVIVSTNGDSHRSCAHYRKLKNILKCDAESVPDEKHLFTRLNKAKYLSKIYITKRYWQLPIAPEHTHQVNAFYLHVKVVQPTSIHSLFVKVCVSKLIYFVVGLNSSEFYNVVRFD